MILDSGERHDHAVSGYNRRRSECAQACRALGIRSLRDADSEMAAGLPAPLDRRARHVLDENARVRRAVDALKAGDARALGPLLDESHASLRDLYEVSTPAVEAAIRRLHDAGALGARLIGGGFGGHVLGLLPPGSGDPHGSLEVRASRGAGIVRIPRAASSSLQPCALPLPRP